MNRTKTSPILRFCFIKRAQRRTLFRSTLTMTLLRSALPVNSQNKFKSQVTTIDQHVALLHCQRYTNFSYIRSIKYIQSKDLYDFCLTNKNVYTFFPFLANKYVLKSLHKLCCPLQQEAIQRLYFTNQQVRIKICRLNTFDQLLQSKQNTDGATI